MRTGSKKNIGLRPAGSSSFFCPTPGGTERKRIQVARSVWSAQSLLPLFLRSEVRTRIAGTPNGSRQIPVFSYRLFRLHSEEFRRTTSRANGLRIGLAGGRLPIRRCQALGLFERARAAPRQAQG